MTPERDDFSHWRYTSPPMLTILGCLYIGGCLGAWGRALADDCHGVRDVFLAIAWPVTLPAAIYIALTHDDPNDALMVPPPNS